MAAGLVVWLGSATLAPGAQAATPEISGTYIFSGSSNCQAVVSVMKNAEGQVIGIHLANEGALNAIVGTATFTPATGHVRLSGTNFDGALVILQGTTDPRRIRSLPLDEDWAYSNTDTTVTINGVVYRVAYGKRSANVVQQFTVAGREENNRCAFGATFIRR
jgi:hypothetical protein